MENMNLIILIDILLTFSCLGVAGLSMYDLFKIHRKNLINTKKGANIAKWITILSIINVIINSLLFKWFWVIVWSALAIMWYLNFKSRKRKSSTV